MLENPSFFSFDAMRKNNCLKFGWCERNRQRPSKISWWKEIFCSFYFTVRSDGSCFYEIWEVSSVKTHCRGALLKKVFHPKIISSLEARHTKWAKKFKKLCYLNYLRKQIKSRFNMWRCFSLTVCSDMSIPPVNFRKDPWISQRRSHSTLKTQSACLQ